MRATRGQASILRTLRIRAGSALCLTTIFAGFVLQVRSVRAQETEANGQYYVIDVTALEFEGPRPSGEELNSGRFPFSSIRPWATLDGEGEVYFVPELRPRFGGLRLAGGDPLEPLPARLAVRGAQEKPISGRLFLPSSFALWHSARMVDQNADAEEGRIYRFQIPADAASMGRKAYLRAKIEYYRGLREFELAGTAWLRHQVRFLEQELGIDPQEFEEGRRRQVSVSEWDRAYSLLSGGRALSENLQLDRPLPRVDGEDTEDVALDSLTGITVAEIDWEPLIADADPSTDALASRIPEDQHAVFFPSFAALAATIDLTEEHGGPLLTLWEQVGPRSAMSRERYEKQLGLRLDALTRAVGPTVISAAALTGGDLYFRTGTDVAVLLEAAGDVSVLQTLIGSQVAAATSAAADAMQVNGTVGGIAYHGVVSEDRTTCSYIATVGNVVIVCNSLAQLERLAEVSSGRAESLAALPEYKFFRQRYIRGEEGEVAFAVISDATIRRWCGPKSRIATARRTAEAAIVSELQAEHLDSLVHQTVEPKTLKPEFAIASATGEMLLEPSGVRSPKHGSLAFQTPIAELTFDAVTAAEAAAYRRWRNEYERNWRQVFDPIAVRLSRDEEALAIDLTVMPLIGGSDYGRWIDLTLGGELGPDAGDSHEGTLLHFVFALNRQSQWLQQTLRAAQMIAPPIRVDPLSWIGETVAVYFDDGPFWEELAEANDPDAFLSQNFHRLPAAVHFDVSDGFKLTTFLVGFRAFVEQSAPGMTIWETKEHEGRAYVQITLSEQAAGILGDEQIRPSVYYAPGGTALVLSFDETTLLAALDRQAKRATAAQDDHPVDVGGRPWLGKNVGLKIDRRAADFMMSQPERLRQQQMMSWSNLTILNEWKRRYPDHDPVELHARVWHSRLLCPGGGVYEWDEAWQTMQSSVFGHPGRPRQPESPANLLGAFDAAQFGLTFENDGLRAKVSLDRR